ncbi:chemotaxis protein CheW [Psychromonas sp.]|nr:chemotaxis protein CheW [Psychromonas sp.]
MKNNNDEAMKNYFDSMLRSEKSVQPKVEKVATVETKNEFSKSTALPKELVFSNSSTDTHIELATQKELEKQNAIEKEDEWKNIEVGNEFQALFFELNHVTFAVPLTDLGGIHHLDDTLNFLMGKPAWFSGVMTRHERLYNIVDTALWLQLGSNAKKLEYSHYVLLGNTSWGLSCEKLLGTEKIRKDQVRWREKRGSRPWLAGMVKKKMCALLHAEELVKLLNQGMDIRG